MINKEAVRGVLIHFCHAGELKRLKVFCQHFAKHIDDSDMVVAIAVAQLARKTACRDHVKTALDEKMVKKQAVASRRRGRRKKGRGVTVKVVPDKNRRNRALQQALVTVIQMRKEDALHFSISAAIKTETPVIANFSLPSASGFNTYVIPLCTQIIAVFRDVLPQNRAIVDAALRAAQGRGDLVGQAVEILLKETLLREDDQ